jgi:hypothetical protein
MKRPLAPSGNRPGSKSANNTHMGMFSSGGPPLILPAPISEGQVNEGEGSRVETQMKGNMTGGNSNETVR